MLPKAGKRVSYTDKYKEELFWIWYDDGCPPFQEFFQKVPPHRGTQPVYQTVINWKNEDEWEKRAKALDEEIVRQIEKDTIDARVNMLKRHAEAGEKLIEKGLEYLEESGITEQRSAINAIRVGAAIEAVSRGIPDALLKVPKMSDKQIVDIMRKLGDGLSPKEIQVLDDFDVDAEYRDVDDDESGQTESE